MSIEPARARVHVNVNGAHENFLRQRRQSHGFARPSLKKVCRSLGHGGQKLRCFHLTVPAWPRSLSRRSFNTACRAELIDLSQRPAWKLQALRGNKIDRCRSLTQFNRSCRSDAHRGEQRELDHRRVDDRRHAFRSGCRSPGWVSARRKRADCLFANAASSFGRSQIIIAAKFEHDPRHVFDDRRFPAIETEQRRQSAQLFGRAVDCFDGGAGFDQAKRHHRVNHQDAVRNESRDVFGLYRLAAEIVRETPCSVA